MRLSKGNDPLVPSLLDHRELPLAVETRFLDVCELYEKLKGIPLTPPAELAHDLIRWREIVLRHYSGDYRHRDSEWQSTKAIAEWTHDMNSGLRNQEKPTIVWSD